MILGLSADNFTLLHVIISLIGIGSGLVVLVGMLGSHRPDAWTAVFLATTVLTSVTGFLFPAAKILPSHIVGILSLAVLAVAIAALYGLRLAGPWRWIYVVSATIALYFNVFVGVVQAFQKVPFVHCRSRRRNPSRLSRSPRPRVLAIFVVLGFLATRRFHPGPTHA